MNFNRNKTKDKETEFHISFLSFKNKKLKEISL